MLTACHITSYQFMSYHVNIIIIIIIIIHEFYRDVSLELQGTIYFAI